MNVRVCRQPPHRVVWGIAPSPVGKIMVGRTDKKEICRIAFLQGMRVADVLAAWKKKWPKTDYVRGKDFRHLRAVTILLVGSDFQCRVWLALSKIPKGVTHTYADLAREIKRPKAVRAVGGACGANPVPLLIPCHRVVSAKGLGGFSGGLKIKKRLLELENVLLFSQ